MSKEIELSRRENSLTIRFLAQCLINDIVFPDQRGISQLISKARSRTKAGSELAIAIPKRGRWEYWFLFQMEDFYDEDESEIKDKSEIDILIRKGKTLFFIEVKAFTNPNATDVKREIIRNYLSLRERCKKGKWFDPVTEIIPILLYSEAVHLQRNPSAKNFVYFDERFLYCKGFRHNQDMDTWNSSSFTINQFEGYSEEQKRAEAMKISHKLMYLTWNDVHDTISELNAEGKFDRICDELYVKKDSFSQKETNLVWQTS